MPATLQPRKLLEKKPRLIVHLGNVGDIQPGTGIFAAKTHKYAGRFKNFSFVGIDSIGLMPQQPNCRQIKADFFDGLKQLKNNSADIISSELALGHHTEGGREYHRPDEYVHEYTHETLKEAYKKLKTGGKLMVLVSEHVVPVMEHAFFGTPFRKEKITVRPITDKELHRTHWTLNHRLGKTYQIIAEK